MTIEEAPFILVNLYNANTKVEQLKTLCELDLSGGSRTAATCKMEHFVIIVNGWKPLTIITKSSILDVAAVLDPPLDLLLDVFFVG